MGGLTAQTDSAGHYWAHRAPPGGSYTCALKSMEVKRRLYVLYVRSGECQGRQLWGQIKSGIAETPAQSALRLAM